MKEVWKDITDYEGLYQASNLGRVKSINRSIIRSDGTKCNYKEKVLSAHGNGCGYLRVILSSNNKLKNKYTHRMVAIAFIPNPENKEQVNHKDGNKHNNNVNNLEWVNRRENQSHRYNKVNTSSKYIGVYWDKKRHKWHSYIRVEKTFYLGCYNIEEDAHNAYLDALEKYGIKNKYA